MRLPIFSLLASVFFIAALSGCQQSATDDKAADAPVGDPLFTLLTPEQTAVTFENTLTENLNGNVLMYEYFYNGGGVAVGDVNNDGLDDLYFSGNMVSNRLYINKGNMQFEDVTAQASVAGRDSSWKTGVTMADVNGDGKLDLYVCYSGNFSPQKRRNELYINEGVDEKGMPRFTEQAAAFGLASEATSTQATFFDYDKDGDLDLFLLNHNPKSLPVLNELGTAEILKKDDPMNGPRLFRNDGKVFKDITRQAGLQSSALSYGLGAGVADFNDDGWPDLYVSNDYQVPDFLYINNRNGTFSDQLKSSMGHTSHFSMGSDVADFTNDARPDILTLDMLPEDNRRQKLLMAPDNYEKFNLNVNLGFNHQYMRNMLHVNEGNGSFSEIGQLAGVSNTDWSWSALFADFDNNGWKDLYITNGYLRDYTNMDFLKHMSDYVQNQQQGIQRSDVLKLVYEIPSSNLTNYAFENRTDMTFRNVTQAWGLSRPSNSNGAAYADLDNDGDLDLIVNNVNLPAFIYQNQANTLFKHHYLKIQTKGKTPNTQGVGAQIFLYAKGNVQYLEQMPTRGYQSSVSPTLHFGLGEIAAVDSLRVVWSSGRQQLITSPKVDQVLAVSESDALDMYKRPVAQPAVFEEISSPLAYKDATPPINDFYRQPLLVQSLSFASPCLVKADVNADGLPDVFVGGSKGQASVLFIQQKGGNFVQKTNADWNADAASQVTDAVFFDANADGHLDLYVAHGGYADFEINDARFQDKLFINDGKGNFTLSPKALPVMLTSTGTVCADDFTGDGKPDLFVGSRVVPGRYPEIPESYLLVNDGRGNFTKRTAAVAKELSTPGLVTDAAAVDVNGDKKADLVVVGEWMSVKIFIQENGKLIDKTSDYFDASFQGWWNTLLVDDFNKDGKPDFVVGNQGLNSQVRVSDKEPATLYSKDFDGNGTVDPMLSFYVQGKNYPYITRDELVMQMSSMGARYPDYKSYADVTLNELFSEKELESAQKLEANYLKTTLFLSTATGKYQAKELPREAQYSPIFAITAFDYDQDGNQDLILGGNSSQGRLRLGKFDANYGLLLKGNGRGDFVTIPQKKSGFMLRGDVRCIVPLNDKLLFGVNQGAVRAYKVKR
ncbi:VCBS repeat-containing protein [Arundinibacter roseus]|uniref:RNA-binding protein n=1 Tax=Arundinibacter roseus TaxID=2070510 RepID=A0A4R4KDG7_9BACT|nr:VCBS repeat-containing protein [Arundinibacter roseus]TDB65957.1 RNA-binding protein [Arundinibacter roseus]